LTSNDQETAPVDELVILNDESSGILQYKRSDTGALIPGVRALSRAKWPICHGIGAREIG
jgi:hypothetical protein